MARDRDAKAFGLVVLRDRQSMSASTAATHRVKLESAEAYRKLAEEMRVLADAGQDLSNRAKLLIAAENYDRAAASFDAIERLKARVRML